jgi:hypothetical protein
LEAAGRGCIPIATTKIRSGYLICLSNDDNLRKEMPRRVYEKSFSYIYDKVLGEYLNLVFKCSERKMKICSITDCKRL